MPDLGLQAVQRIVSSDDPLRTMQDISENVPVLAKYAVPIRPSTEKAVFNSCSKLSLIGATDLSHGSQSGRT